MRKLRNLIQRYERWFMLGLLIFLLAVFTVTDEIRDAFSGRSGRWDPSAAAGSFRILPGERVEVTWEEYEAHRARYTLWLQARTGGRQRARDTDVWTHILLLKAAEREGLTVSNEELVGFLRDTLGLAQLMDDRERYKQAIFRIHGTGAAEFEEAVRDGLTAERLRDLYRDSFIIAPPSARSRAASEFTSRNLEYARVSWAALDASVFLDDARKELAAAEDADAKLRAFFEADPSVTMDPLRFRHPRRYQIEILYTIHRNILTDEAYKRLEGLFGRTWPDLDLSLLEETASEQKGYYTLYTDRLLKEAGYAEGLEGVEVDEKEEEALNRARREAGFKIVQPQVDRELRVRGMYLHFRELAANDPKKSIRELYGRLLAHDDPDHPVCGTEPNPAPAEGAPFDPLRRLLIYREFKEPLTGEEMEKLEDSGVVFTHNFRHRITSTGDKDLPKVGAKADLLGMAGHGRLIWRVLAVEPPRKKTFDELTAAEKDELRDDFYLPDNARKRAREALEALRKKCVDGEVKRDAFPEAATSLGARFHADEWITVSFDMVNEPDASRFWKSELAHMRDRHFLRGNLASALQADRVKKEIKAGDYLPVQVSAPGRKDGAGAAYLVLLHEREAPTADTMPESKLAEAMGKEVRRRISEEVERWTEKPQVLISDFQMEFYGEMQRRIKDELERRKEGQQ